MINKRSTSLLKDRLQSGKDVFCRGLYLSARWFVLSEVVQKGLNFIILPNQEAAEYCASDLYTQVEGDSVFFLPSSGKNIERSNYKSSLGVQRTAAVEKIINYDGSRLLIVTYPEAIEEFINSLAIEDDIKVWIAIANSNTLNGDYDDAIGIYEKILERDENSFDAVKGKALTYYASGDFAKANEEFKNASSMGTLDSTSKEIWDECLENI